MQALLCESFGPPEGLVLREVPVPRPGEGEVLIRVHAAGLNFPDTLIIHDKYQIKAPLPFAPGGELAGVVTAVGPGVTRLKAGDRVAALTHWGGFAEYAVAQEARTTLVPGTMDLDTASAFTLVYGTSYYALSQRAALRPGETVLVLGASGGVGLSAVEIGKAMGARVIAGASTQEKLAIARAHGADELVNYADDDLKARVKALTGGKGVDVVFDPVGDKLADPAFRTLGWEGRYLVIGFAGGQIPALPLNLPLVKGAAIVGVFWGDFVARDPAGHHAVMAELYAMHAAGKLKPLISARFPVEQGGAAIRHMMDRQATGKVIVTSRAG
ncbi:MAG: NADPH:quinone oxidoreductase family protein [Sphingomonadales bacterium]|nr:NADPH:quinone oxidoreductase family protein [Sphingomonadales bacterium]